MKVSYRTPSNCKSLRAWAFHRWHIWASGARTSCVRFLGVEVLRTKQVFGAGVFTVPPGVKFVSVDYGSVEKRVQLKSGLLAR